MSLTRIAFCSRFRAEGGIIAYGAHFHFVLIVADPDDNKFVDCAISANAEFIVTNDSHFDVLSAIPFPQVAVKSIDEFLADLQEENV